MQFAANRRPHQPKCTEGQMWQIMHGHREGKVVRLWKNEENGTGKNGELAQVDLISSDFSRNSNQFHTFFSTFPRTMPLA